ncbi:MAG: 16S rRNA (adenine(1518)-N(6)/adenine(1519)-N(6))-dimethyltransferase RsmA [Simkaniaceae bacterium]
MSLFKPSELHQFLQSLGIQPKKGLSQNFLIDGNVLRKMVAAATLTEKDLVIEIGPGPGVLTEALLHSGAEVLAIEKDEKLAKHLERLQNGKLHIITADFRSIDLDDLLKNRRAKVLANIPYHLTGWILQELLPRHTQIATIHLMIQKEVAERCIARPGTKEYSSFTLFTQYHSDPQLLCKVPPSCFFPKPKVDSAILELKLKPPPESTPYEVLFTLIRTAFQKRRKMLRSSLKAFTPPEEIEKVLISMGISPTARPQELSLKHFLEFAKLLGAIDPIKGESQSGGEENNQKVL